MPLCTSRSISLPAARRSTKRTRWGNSPLEPSPHYPQRAGQSSFSRLFCPEAHRNGRYGMGTLARGEGPLISLGYLKRVTLALATGCDSPVPTTPSPRNRPCSVRWFPSGSAWAGSMRTSQAAQTKLEARSGVPLERQAGSPSKIRHVVDEHQARRPPAERLEKLRLDGQVHGAGPGRPLHAGLVDPVLPLDPALDLGCQEQQAESRLRPVPRERGRFCRETHQ